MSEAARYAAPRRAALSEAFPGQRLIIPAGGLKVRSNDSDYVFRPHSAFAHLTGLGSDREPDAVLVLDPLEDGGHEALLYFRPLAPRESEEFFADSRYGEFWVGARPTLESMAAELGVTTRHIEQLPDALAKDAGLVALRVIRDADAEVSAMVEQVRSTSGAVTSQTQIEEEALADAELARHTSTMRLVKDEWEADEMRDACAGTARAFEAVVADLP